MGGKHHHGAGSGSNAGGGSGGGGGAGSLNSSMCNSVLTNATTATSSSLTQQQQQLQAKYIKSKRHQSRYTNLQHSGHDSGSYLHLNSLWSIWYGVLLTLFQGYLAMHGAYRFLGCSLIPWKIEPVAELNLQIVLSGVVFILLPVFFTSAVFKVGNLANDGIKLATGARERRCTLAPHDGLEEESRGGTLRALWTHGGPTAAFVHILIALCLLLPRLLLEARIIENRLIAIKPKNQKRRISKRSASAGVEIEPEYQLGDGTGSISSSEFVAKSNEDEVEESEDFDLEEGDFQSVPALTPATPAPPTTPPGSDYVRLDGFAGMLQLFFGIDKPIDVAIFAQPPSAEFVNLLCALLVWTVRYPAVFWNTSKSFACVFSLQMIVAALDIVLGYVGVSNLYKLQIYAEAMPVHQPGLILNGVVTLALYLLATALVLASSMVMYLYGHGRLATRMRDRSIITLKANETWIYFAHCASLCFVLALAVVKAPLLNDLSATYKNNLHCPTFLAALIGVTHLLLWIVVWLCLTIKRRWHFKLPPLDNTYGGLLNKASAQPLLMSSGQRTGSNSSSGGNSTSTTMNGGNDSTSKPDMMSTATSTELGMGMGMGMGLAAQEDIYWPKLTPSSPKLKVTFNEVTTIRAVEPRYVLPVLRGKLTTASTRH
ncbi:GL12576 [Drosophila persimilis]|uniref:GL12576 n=1 Tax=Drosophila persimilis TaxID=7234 RepID=B4GLI8_DROPE|nr:GL12576 [Drosophila persimilis]